MEVGVAHHTSPLRGRQKRYHRSYNHLDRAVLCKLKERGSSQSILSCTALTPKNHFGYLDKLSLTRQCHYPEAHFLRPLLSTATHR